MLTTDVSTDALSRDHLKVTGPPALVKVPPFLISMRYNWFSSPLKPLVGGSRHGSSSGFGAAVRAFRVPVLGAVICWNSGNAVLHVNGSSGGLSGGLATFTGSSLTCQTF